MALTDFGAVPASSVLPIFFTSHDAATGANEAASNLAVGDVLIYKGTSMTQRSSTAGITLLDTDGLDLDSLTGVNGVSIDLSDNTDAGFYAVGSFYNVVLGPITIDTQTVYVHLATFRIVAAEAITGKPKVDVDGWLGTAAATPTVAGVPEVDITHIGGTAVTAAAGIPEVKVASIANGAVTAAAIATDAIDDDAIATGAIASTAFAAGAITASAIAADAIGASELAADAVTEIAAAISIPTAAAIADAVWDEDATAHQTGGTFGQAIGDPAADTGTIYGRVTTVNTNIGTPSDIGSGATLAHNMEDVDAVNNSNASLLNLLLNNVAGLTTARATIGSTGNDTTHVHLTGLTYGDDEINNQLLVIYDDSAAEYHARWITDWVLSTELATVATLPFTPQNATDKYWILPIRQDVTGGSGLDAAGVRAAIGLAAANLDTQLTAIDDYLDTEVAAIKAKTDNLPAAPAATGDIPTAAAIADAVWDEDATAHQTQGTFGQAIGDPGADTDTIFALINTIAGYLDTEVAAILADTNELQTDWANGGRLDLLIDAIKAKTDSLTFTTANQVDAQVLSMAANALTAAATASDFGTEVATAVWASATRTLSALGFTLGASDLAADTIGASELAADAITEIVNAVLTTAMTESYNADGAAPTLAQALFVTMQRLTEFAISGTTITVKKLDGSTSAYELTLDDGTSPTSATRAT